MSDHDDCAVSDTSSDAGETSPPQTRKEQLVIEAPPWLENEPAKYEEEVAKKVETISAEDSREELNLIANNLPTYFVAKELYRALDLLRNDTMSNTFKYLGGGARDDMEKQGLSQGYTLESIKSDWTVVRTMAHRVIAWYSLLLNNKDAENYWALLAAARKVYLNWGLFDAIWTSEEEQNRIFLKLRDLHKNIGNKLYELEPSDAFGHLDKHGFVG